MNTATVAPTTLPSQLFAEPVARQQASTTIPGLVAGQQSSCPKLLLLESAAAGATGILWIEPGLESALGRACVIFRDGYVVYAGDRVPTPEEFVFQVAKDLNAPLLEQLLAFARKRRSVQSAVRGMAGTIVSWEKIADVVRAQAIAYLAQLPATVRYSLVPELEGFDLAYGNGYKGLGIAELLPAI